MKNAYIDFHCHILPGMDFDGTKRLNEAVAMCKLLKSQGVATVCATPHFYPWNDDVDAFLKRREETLATLRANFSGIEIIPGAEVQIFKSLPEYPVNRLCIGNSNVVMFELPQIPFAKWMLEVIENVVYMHSVIPVIAHIERYGFPKEILQKFANIPGVIFQITVPELKYPKAIKNLDNVCSCGVPVVFGSDAHDMTARPPQFDVIEQKLAEKPGLFGKKLKTAQAIIENCLFAQPLLEELIRHPEKAEEF